MVLYPNKLPESERVCSGICTFDMDVSVKYLADKIRYARMDSYDFAGLMEKSSEME